MTSENHRRVRDMLGALSLGHLSESEEVAVRSHLDGCQECRRELAEIAPVAQALDSVDPEWLSDVPTPAHDLGERIVLAVAHERRERERERRGRRVMLAAAAVLAVLTIGGLGAIIGNLTATPTPLADPTVPIEPVAVTSRLASVDASAGVVAHTWGVEIKLEAVGLRSGASYKAVVKSTDGGHHSAGAFVGTGGVTMNCNLNSDVLRADAAAFKVLDENGTTVLTANL